MSWLRFQALVATRWLRQEVLVLPSRTAVLGFCVALVVFPLVYPDAYFLRVITLTCIFAVFAASWDFQSGYSGQLNFGHALFFGVAAYASAFLNLRLGWSPWVTIPLAAVTAMFTGLIVGVPCLRLRGTYLALATLSFPVILVSVLFVFPDVTGGELGLSGLAPLVGSRIAYYYVAVALLLGLGFGMWKLGNSDMGLIFHALREDEVAARASGINTTRYKLLAFSLGGLFAGLAGGLYAHYLRIAGPSTLEVALSFQAIIYAVFGGVVTIYGPVAGTFILFPLTEYLRILPELRLLLFGVVVVLVLLFMPQGVVPWVRDRLEQVCPRCKERNRARRTHCRICQAELA